MPPLSKFKVTRVAGTSAGAIVAALYAIDREKIALAQVTLNHQAAKLARAYRLPSRLKLLWRIWNGHAIWDINYLEELLKPLIPETLTFRDVPNLTVLATDLETRSLKVYSEKHDGNARVLKAVINSAAVPIAFRSWKSGVQFVDGGVCENLPIDYIGGQEETDGTIVGIGFIKPIASFPSSFPSLLGALLDAAINNSEERARVRLKKARFFGIVAKKSALDFEKAFAASAASEYDQTYAEAEIFLRDLSVAEEADKSSKTAAVNPQNFSREALQIMERIGRVYYSQHAPRKIRYASALNEVVAFSLRANGPDQSIGEVEIFTGDQPESCMAFVSERPPGCIVDGEMTARAWGPDEVERGVVVVPMLNPDKLGQADDNQRIAVFFKTPFPKESGPFRVRMIESPRNLMHRLAQGKIDEHGMAIPRALGPVPKIYLVLHVPTEFPEVYWRPQQGSWPVRKMTPNEAGRFEQRSPPGFRMLGWIAEDCPPTDGACVEISTNPFPQQ